MERRVIEAVDKAQAAFWALVGALFNSLTGRSNFFLAKSAVAIGMVTLMSSRILVIPDHIFGVVAATIAGLMWWFCLIRFFFQTIKELENQSAQEVLSLAHYKAKVFRLTTTMLPLLSLLLFRDFGNAIAAWLWTGSMYLATQNRPRRDNALKRAYGWVKAHAPRPRLHQPAPGPA